MGSGWNGLQGGAAGPERGLALGMCPQGLHTCPCASRQPLWVVGPQPSPAGIDLSPQGQNGHQTHMRIVVLMSSNGHFHTSDT